jgi:hypothetical protein
MFDKLREWRDDKFAEVPLALFCPDSLVGYYKNHGFEEHPKDVFYIQKDAYQKSKFNFLIDRPIPADSNIHIPSNPW